MLVSFVGNRATLLQIVPKKERKWALASVLETKIINSLALVAVRKGTSQRIVPTREEQMSPEGRIRMTSQKRSVGRVGWRVDIPGDLLAQQ